MAQTIKLKRSATAGAIPSTSDLALGEIAINTADGAVYIKKGNDDIVAVHDNDILHIDTTNSRVGIGTTSPSTTLHVADTSANITIQDSNSSGNTAAAKILFADSGTFGTIGTIGFAGNDDLIIQNSHTGNILLSDANVGIGTSSPDTLLTLEKSLADNTFIKLSNKDTSSDISQQKSFIDFDFVDSNANFTPQVRIGAEVGRNGDANAISKESSGAFVVYTATGTDEVGGGSLTEKLRVDYLGNVGIGTTSPSELLHVAGNTFLGNTTHSSDSRVTINGSVGGISNTLTVKNSAASISGRGTRINFQSNNTEIGRIESKTVTDSTSGSLSLSTASSGSLSTALFIDSSQNVGIGTTSPSDKLSVDGNVSITTGGNTYLDINHGNVGFIQFTDTSISAPNQFLIQHNYAQDNDFRIARSTGGQDFVIDSSGNVGIGTASPAQALHIKRTGSPTLRIEDGDGTEQYIHIGQSNGDTSFVARNNTSVGTYSFYQFDGTTLSERLKIQSDGDVTINQQLGVGTTSPNSLLHVSHATAPTFRLSRTGTGQVWVQSIDSSGRFQLAEAASEGGTQNIRLQVDDTGEITFNGAYTFPTSDGTSNQVLTTNGSGQLSFADVSGTSGISVTNNADNRVLTGDGTNANAEANLLFNGSTLTITGTTVSTGQISTGYGLALTNGNTNFLMYNNTNDNLLYMRDSTNGQMLTTWYTNKFLVNKILDVTGDIQKAGTTIMDSSRNLTNIGTISSGAITSTGTITSGGQFTSASGDVTFRRAGSSTARILIESGNTTSGQNFTVNGDLTSSGRIKTTNGLFQADEDSQKFRQYHIESYDAGASFLLGKIENSGSTDGGVEGVVRFAYDFGSTTNNCAIHFNFAQRSGTARGTWWYEHDDQDGAADRVHVRLIDDGAGNMYVWVTCADYAETFIEANWRHGANIADSGTLSSGTLTTGTTLFDTADDPTSEMHIGKLFAHDNVYIPDSNYLLIGDGEDLQLQHNGSHSYIRSNTGDLYIRNNADDKDIFLQSDDGSGGVENYIQIDGSEGRTLFNKPIRVNDSVEIQVGNSNDLRIEHNGTTSTIKNYTGNWYFTQYADDQNIVFECDDGSGGIESYLTIDGANNRNRFHKNVLYGDGIRADFGNSSDLKIYHDGSNSYIDESGTGNLILKGGGSILLKSPANENMITATGNSAVTLYYDNAAKLATKSDGVDITGELQSDSLDVDGNADISGNLVLSGNLTVNGSTVTNSATNTTIEDALIELGSGNTGANANDLGLILERGTTGDNVFMGWDESIDRVRFATTTATGASTGALTLSNANVEAGRFYGDVTGDVTGNADTATTAGTVTTAAQPNITSLGTLTTLTVDDITLNGSTISTSGSATLDLVGNLTIDVDGTTITLADGGVNFGQFYNNASGQFNIKAPTQDKDIVFLGNDGGSTITALTLDMSAGGLATFAGDLKISKTDPVITLVDSSGANTDPNGTIKFQEIDGTNNFEINYNGANDRLEFRGLVSSATEDLVFINRSTTNPLHVLGNITVTGTVDGRDIATDGSKLDGISSGADVTPSWVPSSDPSYLTGNQTITLSGDVSGSGTTSIAVTIADDSHNHVISNVDGLQSALDTKIQQGANAAAVSNFSDTVPAGGFRLLRVTGGTNRFSSSHHNLIQLPNSSGSNYQVQIAALTESPQIGWRGKGTSWSDWYEIYHEGHKPTYSELGTMAYSNLTGTPTIPTNNNQLTNGAGYITGSGNTSGTAGGLSGTPNIAVGTVTTSGKLKINQAGTGTSNVPSAVAEFSGQSAGGVLKALSLVNSVTAASGNGTQIAFHNASNYSPTGTINVIQAGDNTTDAKMEFQVYRSGLQTVLRIDHDGHVDLLDGNLKINGSSVIDTSRNIYGAAVQGTSFSDGTISGITFIDEDSFSTNSATRVPTQQSIKAYVDAQVAGVVDSAPSALNTLNELAAALGDDSNFSTTTSTALGNRLRVDTASQGLTGTQQANAITNLGITATKAELNVLDGYTGSVTELNYLDTLHATGVTSTEFDYLDGVTSNIQTQLNTKLTSSGTISHANNLNATDDRDIAPEDLSYNDDLRIYFAEKGGLETGTVGSNYQDVLVLNSYTDHTGGDANALAFDKSEKKIYHYQADQAATNWGTAKTLAYTDDITLSTLSITATAAELNKLDGVTATTTELNYTDGVTSNIQTQLDGKQASGSYLTGNQTITLTGDVSGSGTTSIAVTVADDSHNHVISNVDGLQTALDGKVTTTTTQTISGAKTFTGGIASDTFTGSAQPGSYIDFDDDGSGNGSNAVTINSLAGLNLYFDSNDNDGSSFKLFHATSEVLAVDPSGNLTLSGTVDGRDIATDGTKLDTIDTNADVTPSWVPSSDPSYATQSYVGTQISNLVDSAPSTLDTLNELAAALGDDANFSTTVTNSIATKLPLAGGTMTGDLTIPNKIIHSGDTDTYLQFAAADDFRIVVGNSTRAAFNTSKIHFNQEGINQDFQVEGNTDTSLLYVDASADKVGIGTSSPTLPLDVSKEIGSDIGQTSTYNYSSNRNWAMRTNNYGSSNWGGWSLEQSTGQDLAPSVARIGVHLNGNVGINMGGDASTSLTDKNPATALHVGGDITVGSADAVGTGGTASIRFQNDNERSRISSNYDTGGGGRLTFHTDTTGGSLLERMRIDNAGNVGIGTSSPSANSKVTIESSSNQLRLTDGSLAYDIGYDNSYLRFKNSAGDTHAVINWSTGNVGIGTTSPASPLHVNGNVQVGVGNSKEAFIQATNSGRVASNPAYSFNGDVDTGMFNPNTDNTIAFATGGSERARIDSSGNVGIGTASPAHKLEVNGSFAATTKSFDIKHPSKEGMRLKHGVVEGPEHSVYVRGKSKEKVIPLPDYWVDLVHEDSITVQLTAIGGGQNLYVEDIKDNKVYVNGENYFYYIQAERKDVERFEVEYGNSV